MNRKKSKPGKSKKARRPPANPTQAPASVVKFCGVTMTGKQYVADDFLGCLAGIADTIGIKHSDLRLLSRTPGSWFVYDGDSPMLLDIKNKQRTRAHGIVQQQAKSGYAS